MFLRASAATKTVAPANTTAFPVVPLASPDRLADVHALHESLRCPVHDEQRVAHHGKSRAAGMPRTAPTPSGRRPRRRASRRHRSRRQRAPCRESRQGCGKRRPEQHEQDDGREHETDGLADTEDDLRNALRDVRRERHVDALHRVRLEVLNDALLGVPLLSSRRGLREGEHVDDRRRAVLGDEADAVRQLNERRTVLQSLVAAGQSRPKRRIQRGLLLRAPAPERPTAPR